MPLLFPNQKSAMSKTQRTEGIKTKCEVEHHSSCIINSCIVSRYFYFIEVYCTVLLCFLDRSSSPSNCRNTGSCSIMWCCYCLPARSLAYVACSGIATGVYGFPLSTPGAVAVPEIFFWGGG